MKYRSVFLAALAAMLIAAACRKTQSTGAAIDGAFRSAISPDVQTLFGLHLESLKASELYRRHQQQLDVPQLNALSERAGLDPRRDLANILLAWDGRHLLLLARGALSPSQLENKLTAAGAARLSYQNFTLFTRGADAVSFPARGLAIAGSTATVETALTLRAAGGGGLPAELQDRLAEIAANSQCWEVSRGGLPAANFVLRPDLESALSNISAFVSGTSFGARFDSGAHFEARLLCKSPAGAQRVNDAMRGLIGLARLSTNDNELDLLRMWDSVSISKDQLSVRIKADFAADLSDKLLMQLEKLRGHAGAVLNLR